MASVMLLVRNGCAYLVPKNDRRNVLERIGSNSIEEEIIMTRKLIDFMG